MNVVIFGTGNQSEVILAILLESTEFNFLGFICEYNSKKEHCGYPILTSELNPNTFKSLKIEGGIVGLGDNFQRSELVERIKKNIPDFNFINVISNSSDLSQNTKIGSGNLIEANTTIKTKTVIKDHCIINSNSSIGHHCEINSFSSIAPGCMIGGNVTIGKSAAVCIGSAVTEKITIGEDSVVGASSFVNKDIPPGWLCYGTPIKLVRERDSDEKYLQ